MSCRGVHFSITDEQRRALETAPDDAARIDYVKEVIEEAWDREHLQETDKAWDAIHRCLGDFPPETEQFYPQEGSSRSWAWPDDYGAYPLKLCVLGGKKLIDDDTNYFIRLIEPGEVVDLARALERIDEAWMRKKYFHHCRGAWPEYGEEDFDYTWEWFGYLRAFFRRMAGNGRAIIFTVDQ